VTDKTIFIIAGEESGDTHAARLIRELKAAVPGLRIEGLGGDRMKQVGCELRADIVSSAVMGFAQVVKNLRYFRRMLAETAAYLEQSPPDALVLVDYPGFNLRLAAAVRKLGIPIVYYISPQIWAWRPGRIHTIARLVDKMIVIFPFEEELYRKEKVDVTYVGHPILDNLSEVELDADFLNRLAAMDSTDHIGLLPGSRRQEIMAILPIMLETARLILRQMPHARFLIPCSSQPNRDVVEQMLGDSSLRVEVSLGKMYEVAKSARCCIVASGTATLEVASLLTPLVVVYRIGHLTWLLGKRFLKVPHISLVNILAGQEVVPEMLQYRMRPELLAETVVELCRDGERRQKMVSDLRKVRERIGAPGASSRAAKVVSELLDSKCSAPLAARSSC